ncbi:peptidoglycan recognition protein [Streptantibioticus parmotrematis]|uniref:peptidoglycan recognition protein family protein n=1 Tax=Streptantibioticus parmotrematis TaxID=2873249 RepID=UPI00340EAEE3
MRAFIASTVGAACACTAAFALPLIMSAGASAHGSRGAASPVRLADASDAAGSTRYQPLIRLGPPAATGSGARARAAAAVQGVRTEAVRPFSLIGVTWNDGTTELNGTVRVRTRSVATGAWSGWQTLENSDDVPDYDSPERASGHVRGATAPLWVGDSDGVQVQVTPAAPASGRAAVPALPKGLRVDMVDPGGPSVRAAAPSAAPLDSQSAAAEQPSAPATPPAPSTSAAPAAPAASASASASPSASQQPDDRAEGDEAAHAARPRIVTRAGWGADEGIRERAFEYTYTVKAAFVHHTATGNDYSCSQAPAIIRGIYRYHVKSEGWRDIGYNFLIDKCGTIYEGRAGGVTRAVQGAHTLGFNTDTTGIAVIGTFSTVRPSAAAVSALEHLTAWKLGLTGVNADAKTTLVSGGSNKYRKGARVRFWTISGHRDGFATECPGTKLYDELPAIRRAAAKLQGR